MLTTLRRVARVRATRRGIALAVAGAVLLALGIVLALPDVVGLGVVAALAVAVAWVVQSVVRLDTGRGALTIVREVRPDPVVRGEPADVALVVRPAQPTAAAYERLARIRLAEQAAHELAGPHGVRARVSALPGHVQVRYSIEPTRRGRWPLGPLLSTTTDPFGLVRSTQPLGERTVVSVWPRTVDLPVRTGLLGDLENAGSGARLAAADDSVLRDYIPGDDPRRVHWPTAARQGHLMVRTDEAAGVRPVSVLLDRGLLAAPGESRTPTGAPAADGEWAIELVASLACSILAAGHPVRLAAGSATAPDARSSFVTGGIAGRAALLDSTVDVHGLRTEADADADLVAATAALRVSRAPGEIAVAVLRTPSTAVVRELAALTAESATCWALLVTDHPTGAHDSATTLGSAGWRVATARARTPHAAAWAAVAERAA